MAVYTHVSAEAANAFLEKYDVGQLTALKGIAEGVENSNYLVETDKGQFILTLYESRVDPQDLPYYHALLAHLHNAGCKVPRFIEDRNGNWLQDLAGRKCCLIEFLQGVSVSTPTPTQTFAVGQALATMHMALREFDQFRSNPLGIAGWRTLFDQCESAATESIENGLSNRIAGEIDYLERHWPVELPASAIHADLFPDNVLMLGDRVTGLIDFYFACTDAFAFDLAITHSAWCFSAAEGEYSANLGQALLAGYESKRPISDTERTALPILARGASLRFLLTRLFDWINTPADALVTRKDPLVYLKRLDFYGRNGSEIWTADQAA